MGLASRDAQIRQKMEAAGLSEIVGGGDPELVGAQNLELVKTLTQFRPDMSVLDFGCGCGRVALPILGSLSAEGCYTGVDIIPRLVQFCQTEIASHYANSSFYLSADNNELYRKFIAADPCNAPKLDRLEQLGGRQFDLILSFSVFTHLELKESGDYLKRLATLLQPGGEILVSCFLSNDSSRDYMQRQLSDIVFSREEFNKHDACYVTEDGGLAAVAFRESSLLALGWGAGLDVATIHYGSWCGRAQRNSFQDIVVFRNLPALPVDFDEAAYLRVNPDLPWDNDEAGKLSARRHYLQFGYFESRPWR